MSDNDSNWSLTCFLYRIQDFSNLNSFFFMSSTLLLTSFLKMVVPLIGIYDTDMMRTTLDGAPYLFLTKMTFSTSLIPVSRSPVMTVIYVLAYPLFAADASEFAMEIPKTKSIYGTFVIITFSRSRTYQILTRKRTVFI